MTARRDGLLYFIEGNCVHTAGFVSTKDPATSLVFIR